MMDKITELLCYIQNKPYFVVYVLSNGRRVKRFIQIAADKEKATDLFLINKTLKSAWWKPDADGIVIDGLKFICFVDLNNAIPLIIQEETDIKSDEIITTITKKTIVKEDIAKQKSNPKSGKVKKFVEITFPPTVLFQKVEAHFIKEILSIPPNKNEWMTYVFIAAILVLGVLGWVYMNKGA